MDRVQVGSCMLPHQWHWCSTSVSKSCPRYIFFTRNDMVLYMLILNALLTKIQLVLFGLFSIWVDFFVVFGLWGFFTFKRGRASAMVSLGNFFLCDCLYYKATQKVPSFQTDKEMRHRHVEACFANCSPSCYMPLPQQWGFPQESALKIFLTTTLVKKSSEEYFDSQKPAIHFFF